MFPTVRCSFSGLDSKLNDLLLYMYIGVFLLLNKMQCCNEKKRQHFYFNL